MEINKKNAEWLRRIIQRVFQKSLWANSMKILAYLPAFDKNQGKLRQILVEGSLTSMRVE
jgi:hypothetical protein